MTELCGPRASLDPSQSLDRVARATFSDREPRIKNPGRGFLVTMQAAGLESFTGGGYHLLFFGGQGVINLSPIPGKILVILYAGLAQPELQHQIR